MKRKKFLAKTENLSEVLSFVEQALEECGCSTKLKTALSVAIEEVFVNVARYAYAESEGMAELIIRFDEESRNVTFKMTDEGIPFNPLEKPDPDITLPVEKREIGGLGIFIAKKTMDVIRYAYEDKKNILTMIKKI